MTEHRPAPPPSPAGARVALFTGAYDHIADGVSLTLNRLVGHLEEVGAEVLVFAPTGPEPALEHRGTLVPALSVTAPGRPDYRVSLGLGPAARSHLARFDPQLVHVATPDLLGYWALRWARGRGVPVVASYHTHFASYLSYYGLARAEGALWRYLRHVYRRCAHVYVPTPSIEEELRAHGIREGLRRWPRGVDARRFAPERRSLAWRRDHGIADDEVVVAFVSRLVWEKGLDLLGRALEHVHEREGRVRSLVVGDGPAREELEARTPRTLFTGALHGDALARAYASADVFVFPSDTETFGNVVLEAMASGLPTVCADAPGAGSLVEPGTTGLLAPPGDVAAFSSALLRLVRDDGLRRRMSVGARARARDYRWEAVLDQIVGYYLEVLEPSGAASGAPAVR